MFAKLNEALSFQAKALVLRAERQKLIASNIANADTPGYVARDLNFRQALTQATQTSSGSPTTAQAAATFSSSATHPQHLMLKSKQGELGQTLGYAPVSQPSMDNNTVDLDRERSNFTDNAIRYESTLRFINGYSKTILSAIQGQ